MALRRVQVKSVQEQLRYRDNRIDDLERVVGSYHASLSNGSLVSADDVSDLREQLRHAQADR